MTPPEDLRPSPLDWAHLATKTGLSALPIIGGPAAELFSALFAPPLTRRRDEWLRFLAQALKDLEAKVASLSMERLAADEQFVTVVLQGTYIALRNHEPEKLNALRNAVLNAAINRPPDFDLRMMCINLVDLLTPWHMRILSFSKAPEVYLPEDAKASFAATYTRADNFREGDTWRTIERTWVEYDLRDKRIFAFLAKAFPLLRERRAFCERIVNDLEAHGLLDIIGLSPAKSYRRFTTTAFGDVFLDFIAAPPELAEGTHGAI